MIARLTAVTDASPHAMHGRRLVEQRHLSLFGIYYSREGKDLLTARSPEHDAGEDPSSKVAQLATLPQSIVVILTCRSFLVL